MGRGTMVGPEPRAAVTDTATEALKNVWIRASSRGPRRPPFILTLLMSHGASGLRTQHLQSRLLHVRRAANQAEGGAAESGVVGLQQAASQRSTPPCPQKLLAMATASTSGQGTFGLGRKKKSPGLMDQISNFFGGDKKKRSKVSSIQWTMKGGHSGVTMPPHPSNPPLAAGPTKTLWCISSGALFPLLVLNPGGETSWVWPRRHVPRAQSRRCEDAETKAHCPDSSTWEKPSPVHPLNAGAPSSKLSVDDPTADPTPMAGQEDEGAGTDLQPQDVLTH